MFGYKKWYYAYHKLLWHFFGPNKGFTLTLPKYIILSKRKKKKKGQNTFLVLEIYPLKVFSSYSFKWVLRPIIFQNRV